MAKKRTPNGWFHYKRKFIYLGIKQIDKKIALDNLREFLKIMEDSNIKVVPGFGSLLVIIRDKDFITWDEEIDFCILKEEEHKLENQLPTLKQNGFELVRYERIGLYSFMRNNEYIDIYILEDIGAGIRNCGMDFLFEEDFKDTISIEFKGLNINIPRQYERHLNFLYGDWKTPVQYANFNLSNTQKLVSKFKILLKESLPDFMFYPMLHRHHRKNLENFIKKCEDKGIKLDVEKIRY